MAQKRTWLGSSDGFTLVELLLVVAIIALVGSLGGGMYVGSHNRLLVEKAARQFLLSAKYARIMAVEQGQPYQLYLDAENKKFLVTTTQWNAETASGETVIVRDYYCKPVELEGEVTFEAVNIVSLTSESDSSEGPGQKITFQPDGSSESAVVQFGDGQTHYTVAILAATGKASLTAGSADQVNVTVIDLDQQ